MTSEDDSHRDADASTSQSSTGRLETSRVHDSRVENSKPGVRCVPCVYLFVFFIYLV